MSYTEYFTRYFKNNSGYLGISDKILKENSDSIKKSERLNKFHICCSYTKRKKCFCDLGSTNIESNLTKFIKDLYNGEYDIDISGPKIKIINNKKPNYKKIIINEQIKNTSFKNMKKFNNIVEENILTYNDLREVEKKINEEKKICQKCGAIIYGDSEHKGWKNENGEYILFCDTCLRKYHNGANEIRYEIHNREDYGYNNRNNTYYNNGGNMGNNGYIPAYRGVQLNNNGLPNGFNQYSGGRPNFQVISSNPNNNSF